MIDPQQARDRELLWALTRLGKLGGFPVDPQRVQWVLNQHRAIMSPTALLNAVCRDLGLQMGMVLPKPDAARLPLLVVHRMHGWGVLTEQTPHETWVFEHGAGQVSGMPRCEVAADEISVLVLVRSPAKPADGPGFKGSFARLLRQSMWARKGILIEVALASLFINMLNLGASFFSMQVYDRVVPTKSMDTLQVLAVGLSLAVLVELAMKKARSALTERMATSIDAFLSRQVFERLTSVRLDQFPGSVGTLAGQIRGYEQVRSFFSASSLFVMVDVPFAALFIFIMGVLAGPVMMAVPVVTAVLALALGLVAQRQMVRLAQINAAASNRKTGLLVETVEGAETWKSAFGGWKFLARWLQLSEMSIANEMKSRKVSEGLSYFVGSLNQISYGAVVTVGAWLASEGHITMGSVIACSILSGRVLAPLMAMPNLLLQMATAKAALEGIERLYMMARDNEGVGRTLAPTTLQGAYRLQQVEFSYGAGVQALAVESLEIKPGDRIGVLGPIGSGKSTLIKLLTGMYAPGKGKVLIDGLDMTQVSRQVLARRVAYLAQDHRLFEGTLRDNLLLGLSEPSDDQLRSALQRSGLIKLVSGHPQGLELPIHEGGRGLSGGQKQLVAFTRLLLSEPSVYLLDEPTAAMDGEQERQCLQVLAEELNKHTDRTMIVVTHKPSLLPLVNHIIVVANHQIVMAGPRDQILARLAGQTPGQPQPQQQAPQQQPHPQQQPQPQPQPMQAQAAARPQQPAPQPPQAAPARPPATTVPFPVGPRPMGLPTANVRVMPNAAQRVATSA